ncbi:MAG: hypothetical protein WBE18_06180 [Gammaproteobacteria bacterium]
MQSLVEQLSYYAQQRSKPITQTLEYIGIFCLLFAALIFLGWFHLSVPNLFAFNFSWVGMVALLVYYYFLDIYLAVIMTIILIILTAISNLISQPVLSYTGCCIFLFFLIVGIVGMSLGRYFENKPLVARINWRELLIIPLFMLAAALCSFGLRKDLKDIVMRSHL